MFPYFWELNNSGLHGNDTGDALSENISMTDAPRMYGNYRTLGETDNLCGLNAYINVEKARYIL